MILLMVLSACQNKAKTFRVSVLDDAGNNYVYGAQTKSDSLIEALYDVQKTLGLSFEMEEDEISVINGLKTDEDSHWELSINGEKSDAKLMDITVNDGDDIVFTYVSEKKEEVPEQKPEIPETKPEEPEQKPDETPAEKPEEKPEEKQDTAEEDWQTYTEYTQILDKGEEEIFYEGIEGLDGVSYEPVRVLTTRLVSGMNYVYLAKGQKLNVPDDVGYYVIVIYRDTDNTCEAKSVNKLEVPNIMIKKNIEENDFTSMLTIKEYDKKVTLPKGVKESFDKAVKTLTSVTYEPIQILAVNVSDGTDYMALCLGKTTTEKSHSDIYLLNWHEDSSGNCSVNKLDPVDLNYYTAGE